MVKRVFAVLLLLLFTAGFAFAGEISDAYDWSRHIVDDANVLSADAKAKMMEKIKNIAIKYNDAVVLATSNEVESGKYVSFADDMYDNGGYGFDAQKSGILFLIDFNNRRLYMSTTGELIDSINDAVIEKILDDVGTAASDGNYDDTMMNFLNSLQKHLRADYRAKNGVNFFSFDWLEDLTSLDYGIAVLVALLLSLGLYYTVSRQYNLKYNTYQYSLHENARVDILESRDEFDHQTVSRTRISTPSSGGRSGSSGGGGGSSTHVGSSGTSHGGGGRSF